MLEVRLNDKEVKNPLQIRFLGNKIGLAGFEVVKNQIIVVDETAFQSWHNKHRFDVIQAEPKKAEKKVGKK